MFQEIEDSLGLEARRFLAQISPDSANEKLGSTAKVYKCGLTLFSGFLREQSGFPEIHSLSSFLKAVIADSKIEDSLQHRFPDRELLKDFIVSLEKKPYAAKSIRNYIVAVQSLGNCFNVPITSSYSNLPPGLVCEENEKYAWSLERIKDFVRSMESPLHECLAVWFLQSALSNFDVLDLRYSKIKDQLQSGVSPIVLNLTRHKVRKYEAKFRTFLGSLSIEYFNRYVSASKLSFNNDDRLFKISSTAIEAFFARRASALLSEEEYKGRNPMCPSSLRSAFRTFLGDTDCPPNYIEYWMAHRLSGDLAKTYTIKSDGSWRLSYAKYEPVLTFKA